MEDKTEKNMEKYTEQEYREKGSKDFGYGLMVGVVMGIFFSILFYYASQ